jgi:hypothetical protein
MRQVVVVAAAAAAAAAAGFLVNVNFKVVSEANGFRSHQRFVRSDYRCCGAGDDEAVFICQRRERRRL